MKILQNVGISLTHYFIFLYIVFSNYVTDFFIHSFKCRVEKVYDWLYANLQDILNWFMKVQDILWQVEILLWQFEIFMITGQDFNYEPLRFSPWQIEIFMIVPGVRLMCWWKSVTRDRA